MLTKAGIITPDMEAGVWATFGKIFIWKLYIWAKMCNYRKNSFSHFGEVHYGSMPQVRPVHSGIRRMRSAAMRPSWWAAVYPRVWLWNLFLRLVSGYVCRWGFMPRSRAGMRDESEQSEVSFVISFISHCHHQSFLKGLCILQTIRTHGRLWCTSWHVLASRHTFKKMWKQGCRWSHNLI